MQRCLKSFLQINSNVLIGIVKHSQRFQKSNFAMSLQYLKQEVRDEVDFFQPKSLKVYFSTLGITVSYKVILS